MIVLQVEGMSCGHCVNSITRVIQALDKDAQVTVSLTAKQVTVEGTKLPVTDVVNAIEDEGYKVRERPGSVPES